MGKVEQLQRQVDIIQKQIDVAQNNLKVVQAELNKIKGEDAQVFSPMKENVQASYQPVYSTETTLEAKTAFETKKDISQVPQIYSDISNKKDASRYEPVYETAKKESSFDNFEFLLGKRIMPIMASVLIFIALSFIASLIIPFLSDEIKMSLMFMVSIAVTVFAFLKHKKDTESTFFTGLLGCGVGSVYISILITRIHFEMINDIIMYILLLLWGIIMVFVSMKESSLLFQIIGNAGLIISVLLTAGNKNVAFLLPLLIYILIYGATYFIVFKDERTKRNIQLCVSIVALLIFNLAGVSRFAFDIQSATFSTKLVVILVLITNLVIYAYLMIRKTKYIETENPFITFASTFTSIISFAYVVNTITSDAPTIIYTTFAVILAFIPLAISIFVDYENETIDLVTTISSMLFLVIAVILRVGTKYEIKHGIDGSIIEPKHFIIPSELIYSFLLLGPGYSLNKKHLKVSGYIILAATYLTACLENTNVLLCMATILILLALLIFELAKDESEILKVVPYILVVPCIINTFSQISDISTHFSTNICIILAIFLLACINVVVRYFERNNKTNSVIKIVSYIVNSLVMLSTCSIMQQSTFVVGEKFILLIILVFLAAINLNRHVENGSGELVYAGIKFLIIIVSALNAFNTPAFLESIIVLVFAIVCIALGFRLENDAKPLRIFGLVLTLICVFKFIVIDISYDNTLTRAVSFLISGILCFAISAIYNYIEKQNK